MHSMSISHTRFISTKFRCTKFSDTHNNNLLHFPHKWNLFCCHLWLLLLSLSHFGEAIMLYQQKANIRHSQRQYSRHCQNPTTPYTLVNITPTLFIFRYKYFIIRSDFTDTVISTCGVKWTDRSVHKRILPWIHGSWIKLKHYQYGIYYYTLIKININNY